MVRTFPGSVRLVAVREVDIPPMCAEFPTDAFAFFSLLFYPFCGSVRESFVEDGERANDEKRTVINNFGKKNISFHGHHQKMAGYKVSNIRWDGKKTDQAPVNNQLQKFSQVSTQVLLHTIQEITE